MAKDDQKGTSKEKLTPRPSKIVKLKIGKGGGSSSGSGFQITDEASTSLDSQYLSGGNASVEASHTNYEEAQRERATTKDANTYSEDEMEIDIPKTKRKKQATKVTGSSIARGASATTAGVSFHPVGVAGYASPQRKGGHTDFTAGVAELNKKKQIDAEKKKAEEEVISKSESIDEGGPVQKVKPKKAKALKAQTVTPNVQFKKASDQKVLGDNVRIQKNMTSKVALQTQQKKSGGASSYVQNSSRGADSPGTGYIPGGNHGNQLQSPQSPATRERYPRVAAAYAQESPYAVDIPFSFGTNGQAAVGNVSVGRQNSIGGQYYLNEGFGGSHAPQVSGIPGYGTQYPGQVYGGNYMNMPAYFAQLPAAFGTSMNAQPQGQQFAAAPNAFPDNGSRIYVAQPAGISNQRANMEFLMRDEVIDDRSYAAGMLGSDQRAINQFLNQRAASSAHAQRQGEAPPGYSHTGNEQIDDAQAKLLAAAFLAGAKHQIEKPDVDPQVGLANAMPALKKKAAPEHDYRTDYDYAFTRTLHDMEHDPGCNCDFTGADPWLQPLDEEQFKANGDLDEQLYQAMQGNNSRA